MDKIPAALQLQIDIVHDMNYISNAKKAKLIAYSTIQYYKDQSGQDINFKISQLNSSRQDILINGLREDALIQNAKISILESKLNTLLNYLQLKYSGSTNEPVITRKESK